MRSRTVQPIKRRGQNNNRNRNSGRRDLGDTQPMRPVDPLAYRRRIDTRRQVVSGPGTAQPRSSARRRPQRTGLAAVVYQMRKKGVEKEQYFDYDFLLAVIFLMCFGLVMLYSTSYYGAQADFGDDMYYFSKQALIGVLGFAVMFVVSKIDYHLYGAFAVEIFAVALVLMALVKTPLGLTLNGARRWLQLPGNLTLQPAEVTKIAVILYISYELCRLGKKAYTIEGAVRVLALGAIASGGVLFLTDNLSTAIIVMAITCLLYFLIHPKTKIFVVIAGAAAAAGTLLILILSITAANSDNFRLQRILSWLNPEATADTGSFQVMQGLYAIGSGGFFGKGLGNSMQKLENIPEAQNDWILSVICEELGVFGVIVILCLFGFLLYRLMFIAQNAPDLYGSLIASGIFIHIALQVILNIAVVTGILPSTGIILPFISFGGTAVLFLMAEMGIALGIARKIKFNG
ncbi:cell division protein FtsW [Mediterraneibacter glycyrrhizinilyticus]|nr:putative peptidoglycan glycosyltransferase FtsW [Mediterraneibacter glycyrrhizinilyticus]MBM6854689.1 cell division protein FtsW [Mediterraneibacter glycyrrhizinilyticus]